MENIIALISDVCGILAFLVSIFVANKVSRISSQIGITDKNIGQKSVGWGNKQNASIK